MFTVLIAEKDGAPKRLEFQKPELTIGRVAGNDIVIPRHNVSSKHCRIVVKGHKIVVADLKSTNGTFVNGEKIEGPMEITGEDKVYVGDFVLQIEGA